MLNPLASINPLQSSTNCFFLKQLNWNHQYYKFNKFPGITAGHSLLDEDATCRSYPKTAKQSPNCGLAMENHHAINR